MILSLLVQNSNTYVSTQHNQANSVTKYIDLNWDEDNSEDDNNGDVLDDYVETTVYPCAKQPRDDLVLYFTNDLI